MRAYGILKDRVSPEFWSLALVNRTYNVDTYLTDNNNNNNINNNNNNNNNNFFKELGI